MKRLMGFVLVCTVLAAGIAGRVVAETDADFDGATGGRGTPADSITVTLSGSATMDFVYVAPGVFAMGSPSSEVGRYDWEGPQHEVTISKGFYLGKYEVTQAQWEAVMGNRPSCFSGDNKPVEQVSWHDVHDFIKRLNVAAGDSLYRLPTEAEWEYACRAETTTRWSFGDDANQLRNHAWYRGNTTGLFRRSGTKNVGRKLPNPWGLYDMYGNVYEWCQDWYGHYSSSVQIDPVGSATGPGRVIRGGNSYDIIRSVRSADRGPALPNERNSGIGFRLLRQVK